MLLTANVDITLPNKVVVSLEMGKDDVFSAGMNVDFTCEKPPIKVCCDGKIITIPEDERYESDTDSCPTVEYENVCRNGKIINIEKGDRKAENTNSCPVVQVKVCRNNKIISVAKNDVLNTDVKDSCPEVLGRQTKLPNSGAKTSIALVFGLAILASTGRGIVKSKIS